MAGRKKQPVYTYNEKGIPLECFSSMAEFSKFYKLDKNYLSTMDIKSKEIVEISSNIFASLSRVGREAIKLFIRKRDSKFVPARKLNVQKKIYCYNLEGTLIATFKSKFYLDAFLGVTTTLNTKQYGPKGLLFKYT